MGPLWPGAGMAYSLAVNWARQNGSERAPTESRTLHKGIPRHRQTRGINPKPLGGLRCLDQRAGGCAGRRETGGREMRGAARRGLRRNRELRAGLGAAKPARTPTLLHYTPALPVLSTKKPSPRRPRRVQESSSPWCRGEEGWPEADRGAQSCRALAMAAPSAIESARSRALVTSHLGPP